MSSGDWKAMLAAIQANQVDVVRYYLESGIDPNYEHPEMLCTPLLEAIRCDHAEIVALLVASGADPFRQSFHEELSAYQAVYRWRKTHLLEFLPPRTYAQALWDRVVMLFS